MQHGKIERSDKRYGEIQQQHHDGCPMQRSLCSLLLLGMAAWDVPVQCRKQQQKEQQGKPPDIQQIGQPPHPARLIKKQESKPCENKKDQHIARAGWFSRRGFAAVQAACDQRRRRVKPKIVGIGKDGVVILDGNFSQIQAGSQPYNH